LAPFHQYIPFNWVLLYAGYSLPVVVLGAAPPVTFSLLFSLATFASVESDDDTEDSDNDDDKLLIR
jgi:hypothetical protein